MLNQIILVGRIVEVPKLDKTENGNSITKLKIEIDRNFRNAEGIYEEDLIEVTLWKGIAESVTHLAKVGSLVAVKGRIQTHSYTKNKKTYLNYEIIAEKVIFLTGKETE